MTCTAVGEDTSSTLLSFAEAASRVLAHLEEQLPLGMWAVTHRDGEEQVLLEVRDHVHGLANGSRVPWRGSLCEALTQGRAGSTGATVLVPAYADLPAVRERGVRAYVGAAIRTDAEVFGTVCGFHQQELDPVTVRGLQPLLDLLAALLGQILVAEKLRERAFAREAELRRLATRDHLTGLATRAVFADRLGHALDLHRSTGRALTVLLFDLDDFKAVNDTLGHAAGDEVLVALAQHWQPVIQPGNTLARLGGDEFALLVESGLSVNEVSKRAEAVLAGRHEIAGTAITVGVSVGLAHLPGQAPTLDAKEFLGRADAAMYAAKRAGKGRLVDYDTLGGAPSPSARSSHNP